MTILELIRSTKRWLSMWENYYNICWEWDEFRKHNEEVEKQKLILELAEKAYKYRWHKDPDDLPDINTKVEAIYMFDGEERLSYLYYKPTWYPDGWNTPWEVIAWREIEPFNADKE